MEREIEVKILNVNVDKMIEKLENVGAKREGVEYQTNHIFDSKLKPLEDGYLRIRERVIEGVKQPAIMTYKKQLNRDQVRVNNEYSTKIDNVTMAIKILSELGYKELAKSDKKRITYKLGNVRFDIDIRADKSYPDPYMEVEMSNISELDDVLEKLDIDKDRVSVASIPELIEAKMKENEAE